MKTLPTQKRALRKRQALIDAAVVEFSTAGFEVSTAKSIAAVAGVATGTFYQYFENKNEILRVIACDRYDGLHGRITLLERNVGNDPSINSSTIELQFLEALMFVHQFHAKDPELHQVLEQRRALDFKLQQIMDRGEGVLRQRVLVFVRTFNISNADVVADNLFAMVEGLVHRLVFHKNNPNSHDALVVGAQMLASYFIPTKPN